MAEKVLSDYVLLLRKDQYSQDVDLLERRGRPMASIASRCVALLERQDWGKLLADQIYLREIQLGELIGARHNPLRWLMYSFLSCRSS